MKKLAIFLALALVLTAMATVCAPQVQASETRTQCVCCGKAVAVAGHTCRALTYEAWTDTTCLPQASGNYYLATDVTCSVAAKLIPEADAVINLDLNGHTVTSPWRVFQLGNAGVTLNISDSAGGGRLVSNRTNNGQGAVLWLAANNCTVNLYDGVLDASDYVGDSTLTENYNARGLAVALDGAESVFNMYGGTVLGGKTTNLATVDTNGAGKGGSIYVAALSTFNMYGGTVKNGQADAGGNVYSLGAVNIQGGTIEDGKASVSGKGFGGGNLCVYGGTAAVGNNARILNGTAGAASGDNRYGGNIYVHLSTSLTLGDCLISGGTSTGDGGNVRNNGTVTVADGAKPIITKGSAKGSITADTANYQRMGTGDLTGYLFTPWSTATQLPNTAGAYYLTTDVTQTDASKLSIADNVTLRLDLNGYTAVSSWRVYQINAGSNVTLDIYDTAGAGIMKTTRTSGTATQGAVIWVGGTGNVINVYGGTLDASCYTVSTVGGTVIAVEGTGNALNQYGGTLKGGVTTGQGGTVSVSGNSNVYNLYDGTVTGGTAARGGNIQVNGAAGYLGAFNMYGGLITGGTATANGGGNIDTTSLATANLLGGTVSGGTASTDGGNIQLGGTTAMKNITVTGGTANDSTNTLGGGNLYIKNGAAVTAENVQLLNGTALRAGGNVCSYGTLTLNNCTLENGATLNTDNQGYGGGNLAIMSGSATLDGDTSVTGGFVGGTNRYGGNIYLHTGMTLNLGDCFIADGTATGDAGNIRVCGTVNILDDTEPVITRGTSANATTQNYQNVGGTPGDLAKYCYTKWETATALPKTAGNYYLAADVTLANAGDAVHIATSDFAIKLDLNGKTVNLPSGRMYYSNNAQYENVSVSIYDFAGGGKVITTQKNSDREGGILWFAGKNATLNIYGGTFDASAYEVKSDLDITASPNKAQGTVICMTGVGSTLNISGGTFIGGTTSNIGGTVSVGEGTNANITGGTFVGGTTSNYGAILNTSGNTVIAGGTFENGTVTGSGMGEGIVIRKGTFVLTGSPVFKGKGTDLGFTINARHDTIDLSGYTGAQLTVDALYSGKLAAVSDVTCFTSADADRTVTEKNGYLYLAGENDITVKTADGEKTYRDLQTALEDEDGLYIILNKTYADNVTVTGKDICVDLAGNRLYGTVTLDAGKTFRGYDSTTDTYGDAQGRMFAAVSGGTVANAVRNATNKHRYVAVNTGDYYTFNRFYVGITDIVLSTGKMGAGYKAALAGNAAVKSALADAGAFGFNVWAEDYEDNALTATGTKEEFTTGSDINYRTLQIQHTMTTPGASGNAAAAAQNVVAKAFIVLNGEKIETDVCSYNFKTMVEEADKCFDTLSLEAQTALKAMYTRFAADMASWSLNNINC